MTTAAVRNEVRKLWGGQIPVEHAPDAGGGSCPVCDRRTTHLFCSRACARKYEEIEKFHEDANRL